MYTYPGTIASGDMRALSYGQENMDKSNIFGRLQDLPIEGLACTRPGSAVSGVSRSILRRKSDAWFHAALSEKWIGGSSTDIRRRCGERAADRVPGDSWHEVGLPEPVT